MSDDDITFTAEAYTVHGGEKISTGDYENAQYDVTVEGGIDGVGELDAETRRYIRRRLLVLHRDLQKVVQQAAENRIAIESAEDWDDPAGQ